MTNTPTTIRWLILTLALIVAAACGGGNPDDGSADADGGMTDTEWCDQIYPQHPDCLAETLEIDDTVEARRELYLTWTHGCDATGGVFNCDG